MAEKDVLLAWLNDAYGMEHALIQVLEHQVGDAKDYPEVQAKLQQHLEQTRVHADRVKACIESLGGSTSSVKTGLSGVMGKVQALSTGAAQDEMVKNALQDYAAESFEVASYRALIAAADAIGQTQVSQACRQNMEEDEDMAGWIITNLPTLVQQSMRQMAAS